MVHTVTEAMEQCGLENVTQFQGRTNAQRIADDIFGDDFYMCLDKTTDELDNDIKSFASMRQNQGQIRIGPGEKMKIVAFMQWVRNKVCCGEAPEDEPFPVHMHPDLIRDHKSHKIFIEKSKTLSDAAKPIRFKDTMKWDEWCPTFINFLRTIPGRNGVPLSYICRENEEGLPYNPMLDFLDNYVVRAPLLGEAFRIDANEVHTYLTNFMAGNETAESKMLPNANENNGRKDFLSLKEHYEGIGINAVNVIKAEEIIRTLYYSGEKKPHMWWDEFERRLNYAFNTCDKKERRQVYSNDMKLRILTQKIGADFLQAMKASISIELTKIPMTMSYHQALSAFRNEVNRKHAPELNQNTRQRRVAQTGSYQGQYNSRGGGRGGRFSYDNRGGRGRGRSQGRGGRGGRWTPNRGHKDARFITGNDGRTIEVHPSYKFSPQIWENLPSLERKRIAQERNEYFENKKRREAQQSNSVPREVSAATTGHNTDQQTTTSTVTNQPTGSTTPSGSIMGGRNEQSLQARMPRTPP